MNAFIDNFIYLVFAGIGNEQTDSTTQYSSKTKRLIKNRAKAIIATLDKI